MIMGVEPQSVQKRRLKCREGCGGEGVKGV